VPTFHPDLAAARFIPNLSVTPRVLRFMRTSRPAPAPPEDVRIEEVVVPGADGAPPTSARVYRPAQPPLGSPAMSALLWLHGGGFLLGSPEQDEASSIGFVRELGITVVAARYRLAPEHSAPAAVEDAYSSLKWLVANAGGLGVDAERVAIGGASAGAGLAAAGVPCEVRIVEGAFHGFDAIFRRADISRTFWLEQADALRRALLH